MRYFVIVREPVGGGCGSQALDYWYATRDEAERLRAGTLVNGLPALNWTRVVEAVDLDEAHRLAALPETREGSQAGPGD